MGRYDTVPVIFAESNQPPINFINTLHGIAHFRTTTPRQGSAKIGA